MQLSKPEIQPLD
jgi:hypothetical protein